MSKTGTFRLCLAVGYVTDPHLLEKCTDDKHVHSPTAIMHKKKEKDQPKYDGEFELELLKTWTASHMTPLVVYFDM